MGPLAPARPRGFMVQVWQEWCRRTSVGSAFSCFAKHRCMPISISSSIQLCPTVHLWTRLPCPSPTPSAQTDNPSSRCCPAPCVNLFLLLPSISRIFKSDGRWLKILRVSASASVCGSSGLFPFKIDPVTSYRLLELL